MVSKMLSTYVYIGSVGPFENVYINKKKKVNFSLFTFLHLNFGAFLQAIFLGNSEQIDWIQLNH